MYPPSERDSMHVFFGLSGVLRLLKLDKKLADDEKKIVKTVKDIEVVQKTA